MKTKKSQLLPAIIFLFGLIIFTNCKKCPKCTVGPNETPVSSNWSKLSTTIRDSLYGIEFTSSSVGYVCGIKGKAYKTIDGGATFTQMNTGVAVPFLTTTFIDANNGFIGGSFGTLLKTSDAGATWSAVSLGAYSGVVYYIYFETSAKGYLVGSNGGLFKTIDSGATWTAISTGDTFQYQYVKFETDNIGYISGYNQVTNATAFKKTTDGGSTWTNINIAQGNFAVDAMNFFNTNTICIMGSFYGGGASILRTTDGGSTWTTSTHIASIALEYMQFVDSNVGYAVGGIKANDTGTIIKTTDGGITWTNMPVTCSYLEKIKIVDASNVYICGFDNTVLKGN